MILYHFIPLKFALKDLECDHLKVAKIKYLNDPFDLNPFCENNQNIHVANAGMKRSLHDCMGILCFSEFWSDLLMWSHYADKHKGVCFGFEIQNMNMDKVKYINARYPTGYGSTHDYEEFSKRVFFRKSDKWINEKEWRCIVNFSDCKIDDQGNYFFPFENHLTLKEIILGYNSDFSCQAFKNTISERYKEVEVKKIRLSKTNFEIDRV